MSTVYTLSLKNLLVTAGANSDDGLVINSEEELSKVLSLGKIQTLAEKYIGEKFEKGTKKSEAIATLHSALCDEFGEEASEAMPADDDKEAAKEKPTAKGKKGKAPAAKKEPKEKKAPAAKKEPKEKKEPKYPNERKEKEYIFVAPGASVKADDLVDENDKPFTPQGKLLYTIFLEGVKKGSEVTLTKSEILEKLEKGGYTCGGNVWNNFMWYRKKLKEVGLMK